MGGGEGGGGRGAQEGCGYNKGTKEGVEAEVEERFGRGGVAIAGVEFVLRTVG